MDELDLDFGPDDRTPWRRLDDEALADLLTERGVRYRPLVVLLNELHDPDTHNIAAELIDRFLGDDYPR